MTGRIGPSWKIAAVRPEAQHIGRIFSLDKEQAVYHRQLPVLQRISASVIGRLEALFVVPITMKQKERALKHFVQLRPLEYCIV